MQLMDYWFGFVGSTWLWPAVYTILSIHVTAISITVYLHRYSAHRSLDLHPALQHFFRAWLWCGTGMNTKAWTAIHRKHHAVTESEEDPHSPMILGLREIMFRGTEHYRTADTAEIRETYGAGTPADWIERNLYEKHPVLGVGLHGVVLVALFGAAGIVVWGLQMAYTPLFGAGVINGVGHSWGYRNFEVDDRSTNIVPWGIVIAGEELHNNHHTYPNSPKLSVKPWEFDIGWAWIRVFEMLGLARPHRIGPVVMQEESKDWIDLDTIRALMNDRFRVMARYGNEVIAPVVRQEWRLADTSGRKLLKRCKTLLCRDEIMIDDVQGQQRAGIVNKHPRLAELYRRRLDLLDVWSSRTRRPEEALEAFRTWCRDAESSKFAVLKQFVGQLRRYTLPKASRVTS